MRRLLKSKAPADRSTPTPPSEFVRDLASRRDLRALAATSTTALSLGSALYDPSEMSSDGATVRGRDTAWQAAYGAARMALEIAKESSDMFPPLKAVVGAVSILIKNYDQTSDNMEGVKEIRRRAWSLSGVLASPVRENDYAEKARRVELQRRLEGVITRLEPLSDQHAIAGFLRNVNDAKALTGFVQELANAITDYQVSLQQGTYERAANILDDTANILNDTKNILEAADLEILEKLEPVLNAGHQAGHHDKCLPGTRQSVLHDIMLWARNPQGQNVFWLNGLAGTGKSTIAQSFSDTVANERFLGASFFCSRDYLNRRELKNIFPTLSYQLACHYPSFRTHLVTIIKKDPTLAHTSLISQLENLLVIPLSKAKVSCIIVIDALDECIDNQPASAILSVLGRLAKELPLVKFFITGRPEPRIRSGFRLPLLEPITQIFLLHGVELSSVDNDIQLYLVQRLTAITKQRSGLELPNPWPHDSQIKSLTKKSSGLFIFASTLVRFIESEYHDPNERLQLIVSEANSTTHEGRAGIDSLYSQILACAFSDVQESDFFADVRHVLGAIVLAFNPLSRWELSKILGVSMNLVSITLRHLHSIILIPAGEHEKIRIFHKSFPDFLQDDKRCTDSRFYINPVAYHGNMALGCLQLVQGLKRNPCSLPPFAMNQDTSNLLQLLGERLGGAMRYSCCYWARHLESSPTSGDYVHQVVVSVTKMLKTAPPWIEVMSLENCLGGVIQSMYSLLSWRDKMISIIQCRVDTAQQEVYTAKTQVNLAQQKVNIIQTRIDRAQQKINAAQERADSAQLRVNVTREMDDSALQKTQNKQEDEVRPLIAALNLAETEVTFAKAKVQAETKILEEAKVPVQAETEILAEAKAKIQLDIQALALAKAEIKAIILMAAPLYDLATDYLRLSMHFFHPIQQCAQQVYHSALPLSPTSSQLRPYLQNCTDKQLSPVVAFSGAPDTWGLLLRTIDIRPRQLTAITTSLLGIIAACEEIVNIYDAVTFVLQQSLHVPEPVTKIQDSLDGSTLFFAHSTSVTMWDIQTGGLIHTFTTKSKINDFVVSMQGGQIACGLSDGSIVFWDIHSKEEEKRLGNSQPIMAIHWLLPTEVLIATQNSIYVCAIAADICWDSLATPGLIYGMVHLADRHEFLVGTSKPGAGVDQTYIFKSIEYTRGCLHLNAPPELEPPGLESPQQLMRPMRVGNKIASITSPNGVQLFDADSYNWINSPSLLDAATSLAVSLNRNLVAQTKDSIQIFSLDVLETGKARDSVHPSHVYPLGDKRIVCVQPNSYFTILELQTLQELRPGDDTSLPGSSVTSQPPSIRASVGRGPVTELGVPAVMQAWKSGTPLPKWTEAADEDELLGGLFPNHIWIVRVYDSPRNELLVKGAEDGVILARAPLEHGDMGMGKVYDLTFDSETKFHLKAEGPGWHVQTPYDIIASPSGEYSHTIERGEPILLSKPREKPPFTLDENCEWITDAESRRICWISPGNLRRGNGGHFWAGLSLVMLGDDGVVRKLTMREPDC